MITLILSNGEIINSEKFDNTLSNVVACICENKNISEIVDKQISNIHKDIVIKDKDMIFLKIPILFLGKKVFIDTIIDKDKFIVNYYSEGFIKFLKEKITLHSTVNKYMICLFLFQYFSYRYDEELLKIEERVDELFQIAVNGESSSNKEILEIKKIVAKIERFTTDYKAMIIYLDYEFKGIDLYSKVLLILDNTLSLVEDIEASILSCIDIYNSEISNNTNKAIQLLTSITVIALPITIMSGILGISINNRSLVNSKTGLITAMMITLVIVIIEIIYFRKKKYL